MHEEFLLRISVSCHQEGLSSLCDLFLWTLLLQLTFLLVYCGNIRNETLSYPPHDHTHHILVSFNNSYFPFFLNIDSLEKEILDRYLDVVLKGNKDGLKVLCDSYLFFSQFLEVFGLWIRFMQLSCIYSNSLTHKPQ